MTDQRLPDQVFIGLVSISDRASAGAYEDKGIPALEQWCRSAITTPVRTISRLIPDDRYQIEKTLVDLVDNEHCDLVLTTGGTGPSRRDVTPEATLAVATREMPGFGEQMRAISLHFVPTAILSRQVGALREIPGHAALIVNLPGQPKAITETLEGMRDESGRLLVPGIFAAIPYCIDLIGGPYMETNPAVCKAFRPKAALEKRSAEIAARSRAPAQAAPRREPFVDPAPLRIHRDPPAARALPPDLKIITLDPAGRSLPPPCAIVWLGTMGSDIREFSELPEQISEMGGPAAKYLLVNPPVVPGFNGREICSWYDVEGRNPAKTEDEPGIRASAAKIHRIIDNLTASGMPHARIFLAGFSQGAAMALFAGLREDTALGGIISLAGYLPLAEKLPAEIRPGGRSTPILMGHGVFDDIIPLPLAERSASVISQCGGNLYWHEYETEHDFAEPAIRDIALFLRQTLLSSGKRDSGTYPGSRVL